MRNKPALLQYALEEDRASLKHKAYQCHKLKNFSTGSHSVLLPSALDKWEKSTYFESRPAAASQLAHIYSRQHATRWGEDWITRDILMKVDGTRWNMNTISCGVLFFILKTLLLYSMNIMKCDSKRKKKSICDKSHCPHPPLHSRRPVRQVLHIRGV